MLLVWEKTYFLSCVLSGVWRSSEVACYNLQGQAGKEQTSLENTYKQNKLLCAQKPLDNLSNRCWNPNSSSLSIFGGTCVCGKPQLLRHDCWLAGAAALLLGWLCGTLWLEHSCSGCCHTRSCIGRDCCLRHDVFPCSGYLLRKRTLPFTF